MFRDNAPVSAAEAATVILDGVRADRWRILVGDDAHALDEGVRNDPAAAYDGGGHPAEPRRPAADRPASDTRTRLTTSY